MRTYVHTAWSIYHKSFYIPYFYPCARHKRNIFFEQPTGSLFTRAQKRRQRVREHCRLRYRARRAMEAVLPLAVAYASIRSPDALPSPPTESPARLRLCHSQSICNLLSRSSYLIRYHLTSCCVDYLISCLLLLSRPSFYLEPIISLAGASLVPRRSHPPPGSERLHPPPGSECLYPPRGVNVCTLPRE